MMADFPKKFVPPKPTTVGGAPISLPAGLGRCLGCGGGEEGAEALKGKVWDSEAAKELARLEFERGTRLSCSGDVDNGSLLESYRSELARL